MYLSFKNKNSRMWSSPTCLSRAHWVFTSMTNIMINYQISKKMSNIFIVTSSPIQENCFKKNCICVRIALLLLMLFRRAMSWPQGGVLFSKKVLLKLSSVLKSRKFEMQWKIVAVAPHLLIYHFVRLLAYGEFDNSKRCGLLSYLLQGNARAWE